MTNTLQSDLEAVTADMTASRAALVSAVQRLTDANLESARRGGWSVRRVLEHVIQSEQLYVTLIAALRGQPIGQQQRPSCEGRPVDAILCLLDSSKGIFKTGKNTDALSCHPLAHIGDKTGGGSVYIWMKRGSIPALDLFLDWDRSRVLRGCFQRRGSWEPSYINPKIH